MHKVTTMLVSTKHAFAGKKYESLKYKNLKVAIRLL